MVLPKPSERIFNTSRAHKATRASSLRAVVSSKDLQNIMSQEAISIIDTRGYETYCQAHVPSSVPLDPRSLSGNKLDNMWTFDLDAEAFAVAVESKGISADKPVVVYDCGILLTAAWTWWALKVQGHQDARILMDGYEGWQSMGFDTEQGDSCCPLKLQSYFEAVQDLDLVISPKDILGASVLEEPCLIVMVYSSRQTVSPEMVSHYHNDDQLTPESQIRLPYICLDLDIVLDYISPSVDCEGAVRHKCRLKEVEKVKEGLQAVGVLPLLSEAATIHPPRVIIASENGNAFSCTLALALKIAGYKGRFSVLNGPLPFSILRDATEPK